MTRYQRQGYYRGRLRAEYYTWKALRGSVMPGNDPLDGKPRHGSIISHRCEARVAYMAMARWWLDWCRVSRETHGDLLPV